MSDPNGLPAIDGGRLDGSDDMMRKRKSREQSHGPHITLTFRGLLPSDVRASLERAPGDTMPTVLDGCSGQLICPIDLPQPICNEKAQ